MLPLSQRKYLKTIYIGAKVKDKFFSQFESYGFPKLESIQMITERDSESESCDSASEPE